MDTITSLVIPGMPAEGDPGRTSPAMTAAGIEGVMSIWVKPDQ
jgi:hypothetical protein